MISKVELQPSCRLGYDLDLQLPILQVCRNKFPDLILILSTDLVGSLSSINITQVWMRVGPCPWMANNWTLLSYDEDALYTCPAVLAACWIHTLDTTRDWRIMNPTPTNICTFHANKETTASFTFAETPRENQQQVNNVQRKYLGVDKLFLCICGANWHCRDCPSSLIFTLGSCLPTLVRIWWGPSNFRHFDLFVVQCRVFSGQQTV